MAFDAFISYAHAHDKENARAIARLLSRLTRRWYQRRALRVFLDEYKLPPNANLPASIETAIAQSNFLIYLASPEAAQSHWVTKEIQAFTAVASPERIIIVLTDGKLFWNESDACFDSDRSVSLNPALRGVFINQPLWVDVTEFAQVKDRHSHSGYIRQIASVAGALHGKPPDDILSDDLARQRQANQSRVAN